MSTVTGIHHVTCIAGDPQENVDFYSRLWVTPGSDRTVTLGLQTRF